jgi:hypothetical protein
MLMVGVVFEISVMVARADGKLKLPIPTLKVSCDQTLKGIGADGDTIPVRCAGIKYVKGRRGKAAFFSNKDHSHAKYDGKLINPDKGTIACWVKLKKSSLTSSRRYLLNIGGPEGLKGGVGMEFTQDGLATSELRIENLNWKKGEWHHIAYTWKPNNQDKAFPFRHDVALYIDGRGRAKTTINSRPVPRKTITLGAYPVPEYGQPQLFELNGAIEDFRLYDVSLNPAQIAKLAGLSDRAALAAKPAPTEKPRARFTPAVAVAKSTLPKTGKMTTLDKNGSAVIIVSSKSTSSEKTAAKELKTYLNKITGWKIPIIRTVPKNGAKFIFVIGNFTANLLKSPIPKNFKSEEIFIKNDGKTCVLAGDKGNGALNAVYTLLDYLGVRWFAPGKYGEFVPKRNSITIPIGEWRYKPFFSMRSMAACAPYDFNKNITRGELGVWQKRNRTQHASYTKLHKMVAPHLAKIIPSKEFHKHPEYFGMNYAGKRDIPSANRINLCTSNPKVVKRIINKAIELLKKDKDADYFCIEPIDGGGWCKCAKCRALDVDPENYTDRILTLANQVAKAIEKAFPGQGKGARFFAYQTYEYPPEKVKAEKNVQVELTRGSPRLIKEWKKYVQNMQRWDYNSWKTFKWGPMPLSVLPEKFKLLKKYGYNGGVMDESVASMLTLGAPFAYISTKLMWDPDLNIKALLDDFFNKYYGAAAKPMRECFDLIDEETRLKTPSSRTFVEYRSGNRFDPTLYSPKVWKKCLDLTKRAEALVKDDPLCLRHVQVARMTYLFSDVARDARIAKQYISEKKHPFWKYINSRSAINSAELQEAITLAMKLGIKKVRGNAEPTTLEAIIAAWAYPLKININPFQKIFYPEQEDVDVSGSAKKWKLVFEDDFNRSILGDNWKNINGSWKIKDNYLQGRGAGLFINKKFPGDQKLEFDAWVDKKQVACDLDAIIASAKMKKYGRQGYLFAFGSWGNNHNKISKQKAEIFKNSSPLIKLGKHHKIKCEKEGQHLRWWIDGKLLVDYVDPFNQTLNGEYIGFYIDSIGQIDNVKVYNKK